MNESSSSPERDAKALREVRPSSCCSEKSTAVGRSETSTALKHSETGTVLKRDQKSTVLKRNKRSDRKSYVMDFVTPSGFRDILPEEAQVREDLGNRVQACFASHGFAPIEKRRLRSSAWT